MLPSWYKRYKFPNSASFVVEQIHVIKDYGHNVGLIAVNHMSFKIFISFLKSGNKFLEKFDDDGIYTIRLNIPKLPFPSFIIYRLVLPFLFRCYVKNKSTPDLLHAHSFFDAGLGALGLKKRYGLPVVLTEHFSRLLMKNIPRYKLILFKNKVTNIDSCIAVSQAFVNVLNEIACQDIFVAIPNLLPPIFENNFDFKKVKNDKFIILSVGGLNKNKNHESLIRAFKISFENMSDVVLKIVGKGPEQGSLISLIDSLNLTNQVELLGELSRKETLEIMQLCNIFALSSNYETFGVVVIEALACGKPVVSTKCVGPEEIINNSNGILVERSDLFALSRGLKSVYKNFDNYSSSYIRKNCIKNYGKIPFYSQINEVYSGLILNKDKDKDKDNE
jgi:glycosyltransferase involved in cell wall biosynthesis